MTDHFAGSQTCRVVVVSLLEMVDGLPASSAYAQADVDGDLEGIFPRPFLASVLSVHVAADREETELQAVFEAVEFAARMGWTIRSVKYPKDKEAK